MERLIGIRHRVKQTADGEARPTQVFILVGDKSTTLELPDDQAELDFVRGSFPVSFRKVELHENPADFSSHHLQWRKVKEGKTCVDLPQTFIRKVDKEFFVLDKVPETYEGLQAGDTVCMVFGGSGDRLAAALSRRGEEVGATVWRVPTKFFCQWRGESTKNETATLVAKMFQEQPQFFYQVEPRDRALIRVAAALRARQEALEAHIACAQRIHSSFIGSIFLSEDGFYPEGAIEDQYKSQSASDVILQNLEKELARRNLELKKAVEATDVWENIFKSITGIGPRLAASFIAKIGDIRRFDSDAKLKKYCGAHVNPDGSFPRQRRRRPGEGKVDNSWNRDLRQALYLLGDQFNRRPDSVWGQKLLEYKIKLREKHPEPVLRVLASSSLPETYQEIPLDKFTYNSRTGEYAFHEKGCDPVKVKGARRYSDGHIHRMATWRTLTKFVEWLYSEWWKMEEERQKSRTAVAA